jgi:hypothetical protein
MASRSRWAGPRGGLRRPGGIVGELVLDRAGGEHHRAAGRLPRQVSGPVVGADDRDRSDGYLLSRSLAGNAGLALEELSMEVRTSLSALSSSSMPTTGESGAGAGSKTHCLARACRWRPQKEGLAPLVGQRADHELVAPAEQTAQPQDEQGLAGLGPL